MSILAGIRAIGLTALMLNWLLCCVVQEATRGGMMRGSGGGEIGGR
jgi:hypothetical protein